MKMARTYATLSLPLDEMRQVAHRYGATLNDLTITIVDEGVHRYLRQTGRAFPHRLVAMCPMSLRDEGDTEAKTKASAMFVHLGQPASSVHERIGEVVAGMAVAKQELRTMSKDAAMMYAIAALGLAELRSAPGISQVTRPLANLIISNVPGGKETMYSNGARLVGTFPVSAVAASIGLNATVTSDSGRMDFGFIGNGATMYSLSDLARHVADAYEELKTARKDSGRGARGSRRGAGAPGERKPARRKASKPVSKGK
jgi:diacylglycerol O-acyltransferase